MAGGLIERIRAALPLVVALGALPHAPALADSIAIPGTSIVIKPYVEGEGGYDSNPDNSTSQKGSSFEKAEAGFRITSKGPSDYYEFNLKSKDIHFNDLEREDRWELRASLDTERELGSGWSSKFGGYYLRDFVTISPLDLGEIYSTLSKKADDYRFKFLARTHAEHNLNDGVQGKLSKDDFNVSRDEAFDFVRSEGQVSFITFTNTAIHPFTVIDFANINYYNQIPGASIDRDAFEGFAIAGLRFEFTKSFRIDLGGRYNKRNFDDRTFRDARRAFVDINAYWKPMDDLSFSLVVERFFKEPSTSFGLADDVRTVGVTMDWRLDKYWRANFAAYYDRIEPIGEDLKFNKYTATASLTYEPNEHVELFLSGLTKWSREIIEGDRYDRFKIGAGVRYKY